VIGDGNGFKARLLTVREAARLMGAPDYKLPGNYNEGYFAMGDAVAVPVAAYLAKRLLAPLAASAVASRPTDFGEGRRRG
jgi:DNA (cytosine-5)-methyltransferase 1